MTMDHDQRTVPIIHFDKQRRVRSRLLKVRGMPKGLGKTNCRGDGPNYNISFIKIKNCGYRGIYTRRIN